MNELFTMARQAGQVLSMEEYLPKAVAEITRLTGENGRALLALSGGVDSSVCAALVHKAMGQRLTCLLVDHGLLRLGEADRVEKVFSQNFGMQFVRVNAAQAFLGKLAGVTDPEEKRKRIGEEFIRVFEREARQLGQIDYLVQGTIYPDVTESGEDGAKIVKSHHNVGGLPESIDFKGIIEPVRPLYKPEVRALGSLLGLPDSIVNRQPFPGPGLAVRIIGEVTAQRVAILQQADAIFTEELEAAGVSAQQYFAILAGIRSTGVWDEARLYGETIALRAVSTQAFTEASIVHIPYSLLEKVSKRITLEVPQVNRVVYDITSKPSGTIEWE